MVKPLSPHDIGAAKKTVIPDAVIEAFNELIAKNYTNGKAKVLQREVVELIRIKLKFESREPIYNNNWLNVEDLYRAEGWKVTYDKPVGWGGETFEAYFEFRKTICS